MGISAVPGSGKTYTLSYLAAQLVATGLADDQEVLIVTLVNSAVNNFRKNISGFIQDLGLVPGFGYRVRTLHGLAHDIVRLRPGLVGLADDFGIVDERESAHILEEVVTRWLREHPHMADPYLAWGDLSDEKAAWVKQGPWPDLALDMARSFVKRAKDWRLGPDALAAKLEAGLTPLALAKMATAIYRDYQLALTYRGSVDFDDLIRLAHEALSADQDFLGRLRRQWPFILEDEAQDSSKSQEDILRTLAGPDGNWVRVGDPNQSVYHTFTNASPEYLRHFLDESDVARFDLPNSGRSQPSIIHLSNYLVDWSRQAHPVSELRGTLTLPHIQPTPPGDPQPNPTDNPSQIHLIEKRYTPESEVSDVVRSVQRWMERHHDETKETIAVLTPRNKKGVDVVNALRQAGIPHVELLNSTAATRSTAGVLGNVLRHLSQPTSARQLATLFRAWRREEWDDPDQRPRLQAIQAWLRKLRRVEAFLFPHEGTYRLSLGDITWPDAPPELTEDPTALKLLKEFRDVVRGWHAAVALPVDQLLLTLAQVLFSKPTDLALAHKLAVELRHRQNLNPDWRLPELTEELAVIARNQRRFLGFTDADIGFRPEAGVVTVATMHRAKGLEWDRVYMMAVNNYNFPSAQSHDSYISEKWFIRDQLNLEAETIAQLKALSEANPAGYVEGMATLEARTGYAAERLRLLYVGITRAKKELIITWNSGRSQPQRLPRQQATPFIALSAWWVEANSSREAPK
ncbi:MAG: ATP-dependent helicase [Anaerolineales bacterium]|nr:MAG: ATP-dependent helicase [Anaerolineales bacterium]